MIATRIHKTSRAMNASADKRQRDVNKPVSRYTTMRFGVISLRTVRSIDMTATVRSMEAEQIMPPEIATHVVDLTSMVRLCTHCMDTL